jgi:hypothetical protein
MSFYKILIVMFVSSILSLSIAVASNDLSDQSQIQGDSSKKGVFLRGFMKVILKIIKK